MSKLEVFYDYSCPFCLRGHDYLLELLPQHPEVEVEWRPCEAHPRPEEHGRHSDLCARGMYIAGKLGADLMEYHQRMYKAGVTDRSADIEDGGVLAGYLDDMLDKSAFQAELAGSSYQDILDENNSLVWDVYDCPAVPSFRLDGKLLKSIPGVGVTKEGLAAFLGE
ncbi:MAG: DsbA family protein [Peptococcaceae bacterium]|jgi:predicted DsbA family dithiol-disulfide isomerase|nr:DsbA family protein [Peptococcaceae bacterium]